MTKINNNTLNNDEIDLTILFHAAFKNKLIIVITTIGILIASTYLSFLIDDKYQSAIVLKLTDDQSSSSLSSLAGQYGGIASLAGISIPDGGNNKSDYAMEVLKSKSFLKHILSFDEIKEKLFAVSSVDLLSEEIIYDPDLYNSLEKKWVRKPKKGRMQEPSYLEVYEEIIKKDLFISKDLKTSFITISFSHESPYFTYEFLNLIVSEFNKIQRKKDLTEATNTLKYLENQLEITQEKDIRDSINDLIESQLKMKMLANVKEDYLLTALDLAYIPEKKSSPNRFLIVFLSTFFGMMLTIFYFFYRELKEKI